MLVNHTHKFLFVHIQKTAGTSITSALESLTGNERIAPVHTQIDKIDHIKYKDYFKFAIVRNPFDRLLSWYNMIIKKGIHNDWSKYILENSNNFSDFLNLTDFINETQIEENYRLEKYLKSISFNQLDYLTIDGKLAVDFIGRFENIQNDFKIICNTIDLDIELKHLNSYVHDNYTNYYNLDDIKKVERLYQKDINYFKYEFGK